MSVSAMDFAKSDAELAADTAFSYAIAKYSALASPTAVEATVKALKAKHHSVQVFKTSKEAVEYLINAIPANASVSYGGSTTLGQMGFLTALAARKDVDSLRDKANAAVAKQDWATYGKYIRQGAGADVFLSSASAITQDGNIHAADASGSRICGWGAAGKLFVVAGTNKIVTDDVEAEDRLLSYQYKLESARCRVAYKIPKSSINNQVAIRGGNHMGPRVEVILVQESLGF